MKNARIADGKIVEILEPVPGFTLAECFHPSVIAACVDVEDSAVVGDDWPPPVVEAPVVEAPVVEEAPVTEEATAVEEAPAAEEVPVNPEPEV